MRDAKLVPSYAYCAFCATPGAALRAARSQTSSVDLQDVWGLGDTEISLPIAVARGFVNKFFFAVSVGQKEGNYYESC